MSEKTELLRKFEEAVQSPPQESDLNDALESITTLHQDDWIRILLIRQIDTPDMVTIEVESSLPLRAQGNPTMNSNSDETRDLLEGMIQTLRYLLNLESKGFFLDVIGQDCMWTAFCEFKVPIDPTIFDILAPR